MFDPPRTHTPPSAALAGLKSERTCLFLPNVKYPVVVVHGLCDV